MKLFTVISCLFLSNLLFSQWNQVDERGRKQGPWAKVYEGRKVYVYKGQFKDDKPIGKFIYYYSSGKVKAVIKHDSNGNRSEAFFYHENGVLMSYGIFRDMKKDSTWVTFTKYKHLNTVENYNDGKLDGEKTVYYLPEKRESKQRIPSAIFHYKNGKLHGKFKEYFVDMSVKTEGEYYHDKKHGVWVRYHPTGKKMMLTRYHKGIKHGWAFAYDKSGKETNRIYYYYGRKLEGEQLKKKLRWMKENGIDPNKYYEKPPSKK